MVQSKTKECSYCGIEMSPYATAKLCATCYFEDRDLNPCRCNNPDPLLCHECEESDGVCYCKCHEDKYALLAQQESKEKR